MSVFAKGMQMPKDCTECRFHTWEVLTDENVCAAIGKELTVEDTDHWDVRPDWCPLVELPSNHGRLIDENEVRVVMNWLLTQSQKPTWNDTYNAIQEMNAVIEAE